MDTSKSSMMHDDPRAASAVMNGHELGATDPNGGAHGELSLDCVWTIQELAERNNASPSTILLAGLVCLAYRFGDSDHIELSVAPDLIPGDNGHGQSARTARGTKICIDLANFPTFDVVVKLTHDELSRFAPASDNDFVVGQFLNEQSSAVSWTVAIGGFASACDSEKGTVGGRDFRLRRSVSLGRIDDGSWDTIRVTPDGIDSAVSAGITGCLEMLLAGALAEPNRRVAYVPLINSRDWHNVSVEWKINEFDYPKDRCLYQHFETQVELHPGAIAIVTHEGTITYAELNRRANQLAHYLLTFGIDPEAPVAICLDRSIDLVVAVLGVFKAGGACVLVDPDMPRHRMELNFAECRPTLTLTQASWVGHLPESGVVFLDTDTAKIAAHATHNLPARVSVEHLCAIFFTSGTTGSPKGVLFPHRECFSVLWAQLHTFELTPADCVLHTASVSFASFLGLLVLPLSVGASIFLARSGGNQDPEYLARMIVDLNITVISVVPSVLRYLVALLNETPNRECTVRHISINGDALPPDLEKIAVERLGARLHKSYGLTEAPGACDSNCRQQSGKPQHVTIGRPTDMDVYVLDRFLQPVPIGVQGEIFLNGPSLARGYLHQPELTAERFLPNPFNHQPGARMYRTGDLARWLPEGIIAFLGRADNQVKVRGTRIQVEEIEAALSSHPSVREAVVLLHQPTTGDRLLIAVVGPIVGAAIDEHELRQFLRGSLSVAMIPTRIIAIAELPRTPSGKVDRRAVSELGTTLERSKSVAISPRSRVEKELARIWADVLQCDEFGTRDNFFELGGDSIRAIQIASRAIQAGIRIAPKDLLEHETIERLALILKTPDSALALPTPKSKLARQCDSDAAAFPSMRLSRIDVDDLIVRLRAHQGGDAEVEDLYPLTPMQEGMLFHALQTPEAPWYFQQFSYRLKVTATDALAHQRAWQHLVDHHAALRTAVSWKLRDEPFQVVYRQVAVPWEQIDWRGVEPIGQQDRLGGYLKTECRRGFDLSKAPLLRLALIQESENSFIVVCNYHHLIFDGWSAGLLMRDLLSLHHQLCDGQDTKLPSTPPMREFVEWLQRQDAADAERFWRQELQGFTTPTLAATQRPPVDHSPSEFDFAEEILRLSPEIQIELGSFAQKHRLTLGTIFHAAWAIVLSTYTGESDVVFGSTVSGRASELADVESTVGLYMNTLPARVQIRFDQNLADWLRSLQGRLLRMSGYAHSSLGKIQRWTEVPSGQPFFDHILIVENLPPENSLPKLNNKQVIQDMKIYQCTNYPLIVEVFTHAHLSLRFVYHTAKFDRATMQRMLNHFGNVLESFSRPVQFVADLSLLSPAEKQHLLRLSQGTETEFPRVSFFHELFEAQVQRTPTAVAVVFEDTVLTYEELNRRANQLAHLLISKGAGPEAIVAICLERSAETIIAMIAIWKAGSAYLPLDTADPAERLALALRETDAILVLTQERLVAGIASTGIPAICLDRDQGIISKECAENCSVKTNPSNLAYIIYTSGSTGAPKGVHVEHRGLCNLSEAQIKTFELTGSERMLQFASFNFDASVFETVMALRVGAALYLGTRESLLPGHPLLDFLNRHAITVVTLPPSALAMIPEEADLPMLRTIIVAGEVCSTDLARRWSRGRRFFNAYGPTETTVWATTARCTGESERTNIGNPINNVQVYVLGPSRQLAPLGVPGEIFVGGEGVARGYGARSDLTAARFVPDAFSPVPGRRMYATGDWGCWIVDGSLAFLGRRDHQIKIRGYRIELGEIEEALRQHPEVREVVVLARETSRGNTNLVAYVCLNQDRESAELQRFLDKKLPRYMVPYIFVKLDAFPHTTSGKINRHALPAPEGPSSSTPDHLAPTTETEKALAAIWEEALGVNSIGITDDFYQLGGDSLLVVRILFRIEKKLGVVIPVADFLQAPTVQKLSQIISDRDGLDRASAATGSKTVPKLFCLSFSQVLAKHLAADVSVYSIEVVKEDTRQYPSIEALAVALVKRVREIQPQGPYYLFAFCFDSVVALAMGQEFQKQGQQVGLLALADLPGFLTSNVSLRNRIVNHVSFRLARLKTHLSWFIDNKLSLWPIYLFGRIRTLKDMIRQSIAPTPGEWDNWGPLFSGNVVLRNSIYRYVPRPFGDPVKLIMSQYKSNHEVEARARAWRRIGLTSLQIVRLPGGHAVWQEPNISLLAQCLRESVRQSL
jgi:amino acid adenylation domain-containing protein